MILPNSASAVVPEPKVRDYLFSSTSPQGKGKAQFFRMHGFRTWTEVAEALRKHACTAVVRHTENNEFGKKYLLEGPLSSPDRRNPIVWSVWIKLHSRDNPVLVTAYPRDRQREVVK